MPVNSTTPISWIKPDAVNCLITKHPASDYKGKRRYNQQTKPLMRVPSRDLRPGDQVFKATPFPDSPLLGVSTQYQARQGQEQPSHNAYKHHIPSSISTPWGTCISCMEGVPVSRDVWIDPGVCLAQRPDSTVTARLPQCFSQQQPGVFPSHSSLAPTGQVVLIDLHLHYRGGRRGCTCCPM